MKNSCPYYSITKVAHYYARSRDCHNLYSREAMPTSSDSDVQCYPFNQEADMLR